MTVKVGLCRICLAALGPVGLGRPALYCSARCRRVAERRRRGLSGRLGRQRAELADLRAILAGWGRLLPGRADAERWLITRTSAVEAAITGTQDTLRALGWRG